MAYLTKAEYDVLFPNNGLTTEEFDMYVEAASVIVDRLSINRIPFFWWPFRIFSIHTRQSAKSNSSTNQYN